MATISWAEMMMRDSDLFDYDTSDESDIDDVQPAQQKAEVPTPGYAFRIGETAALIFIIFFAIIVFAAFFIERKKMILEQNNTGIPNATEFIPNLDERKMKLIAAARLELWTLEVVQNIANAKQRTSLKQFPEYQWDKWTPDPSKFEGVQNFLYKTEMIGTPLEYFLYTSNFKIDSLREKDGNGEEEGHITHREFSDAMKWVKTKYCKSNKKCYESVYKIKNGDLYLTVTVTTEKETLKMNLVYYIPSKYLM